MPSHRFSAPWLILNPRAGSGRAGRRWPALRGVLEATLGPFETRFTEAPDHATELTREALHSGADLVVATGGDGTLSEVVNGYFEDGAPINSNAAIALIPIGTGGDFRRSANLPTDPADAMQLIGTAPVRSLDTIRIELVADGGTTIERYCINIASFGLGGDIALLGKSNFLTRYSGKLAFLWATTSALIRHQPHMVRLSFDGAKLGEPVDISEVVIGNGRYNGGGMLPCPLADLSSGKIDISVIRGVTLFEFLRAVPKLYSGAAYEHPKCLHYRVDSISATSDGSAAVRIEVDGEAIGQIPLEARILPGSIRFAGIHESG